MQIVEGLIQNSPQWHEHRRTHFNASDAPAMMGCSPYKTRNQLLKEYATDMRDEVNPATQDLFDAGHRAEALARPLAEKIIGEDLFPVVAVRGKLSASFDGITLMEDIIAEHKLLNDAIRAMRDGTPMPRYLAVQIEHQLHVAEDAKKCLFMATKWNGEELEEEFHCWYISNSDLQDEVLAGWAQFEIDLANYQHVEVIEPPKAEPIADLPAVTVQARGELTMSNLEAVTPAFDRFLSGAIVELKTDDDFALAEAQAKKGREVAKQCKLTAKAVVDQMATVADVTRKLEDYAAKFDALALKQEKLVATQKETRKTSAKLERDKAYAEHIAKLNAEIAPLVLVINPNDKPDFIEAMKNQRTLASLYNKLDTELARAKIAADAEAAIMREKIAHYRETAKGFQHLFADLQSLITRGDTNYFKLAVKDRIEAHKAAEEKRQAELRERIAAEEKAKAEAAVTAKVEAEKAAEREIAAKEQQEIMTREREAIARTQAVMESAQLWRVANAAQESLLSDGEPAKPQDDGKMINLGQINELLAGVKVDAEFLKSKGFVAKQEKNAKMYRAADFEAICKTIMHHIMTEVLPKKKL